MMKAKFLFLLFPFFVISCKKEEVAVKKSATETKVVPSAKKVQTPAAEEKETLKTFSNERFREVNVVKKSSHEIIVSGKAQIFEARFGWSVTNAKGEVESGSEMADLGAPEWGNFKFTVHLPASESLLHLHLFENSAKDGSRQFELDIPLQ